MLDQAKDVLVTVGDGFLPDASTEIESGKYDKLGYFLVKHPDVKDFTYKQAGEFRKLCAELDVALTPLVMALGTGSSYLSTKFPDLAAAYPIPVGGGHARKTFTRSELAHLIARGATRPAAVPQAAPSAPAPTTPQASPQAAVSTISIALPEGSLMFPLANKEDLDRVIGVLTALVR